MPLKFSIYTRICYLVILLSTATFFENVYWLTKPGVRVEMPLISATILIIFFTSYFIIPILGLQLTRCMANGDNVKQSTILVIRIFFIVQIVYQILIFYYIPDIIRSVVLLMKHRSFFDSMYRIQALQGLCLVLLAVSTLYLEIFTFPMIKAVKRNYQAVLAQLDNLGG